MTTDTTGIARWAALTHRYFLPLLILSYVLAALMPAPGLYLRSLHLGSIVSGADPLHLSMSGLLLSALLFNAGLGLNLHHMRRLGEGLNSLLFGLLGNMVIPVFFLALVALGLQLWHDPNEVTCIILGLALVAAMPVAGSSAAWTQNAEGDVALSLGLVLGSTLLSPLTTPLILEAVARMTQGDMGSLLGSLGGQSTTQFLLAFVLMPTFAGIVVRQLIGSERVTGLLPWIKTCNTVVLLTLCYTNAAISLPSIVAVPDWDFLAILGIAVVGMCSVGFASGAIIARILRVDPTRRVALIYGLGMSNNGTALVLASLTFAAYPRVLLPVIVYNLVQHLIAGIAQRWIGTPTPELPDLVETEQAAEELPLTCPICVTS